MKAKIIPEHSPDNQMVNLFPSIVIFVFISIVFVRMFSRLFFFSGTLQKVLAILEKEPSVEYEHKGQTATHDIITLSIAVNKTNFSLTALATKLFTYGCDLKSTTSSDHPSFRGLTIYVPKTNVPIISSRFVFLSGVVAGGLLYFWLNPIVYNTFMDYIKHISNNAYASL